MAYQLRRMGGKDAPPALLLRAFRWGSARAAQMIEGLSAWITVPGGPTSGPVLVPVRVENDRQRVVRHERGSSAPVRRGWPTGG